MNLIIIAYILVLLLGLILLYSIYGDDDNNTRSLEGFYPRRWWWGGGGPGWGWRRPWLHGWGNWRPYGYYPAYSGYWKQCQPQGTWCPATMSCKSSECQ